MSKETTSEPKEESKTETTVSESEKTTPESSVKKVKETEPKTTEEPKTAVETKTTKKPKAKKAKTIKTKTSKVKPSKKEVVVIDPDVYSTGKQAEVNIGTIGHVDHGKSTLVKALTGIFPDTHSEELKRGITIRLGYADTDIRFCSKCPEDSRWTTEAVCPKCKAETKVKRRISFVDAPGHEVLMATLLTGAAIFDGAILVIAANEKCPQAQTREHLAAMDAVGITNIIIVQNKVELVTEAEANKSHADIKAFVKGTVAEGAPIIPMSAVHGANLDILVKTIEDVVKTPKRDEKVEPRMFVARSFEVNKPGTAPKDLLGGVLGGSIIQGVLKEGDDIEIVPGARINKQYIPVKTKITSIYAGTLGKVKEAKPGGLMSIRTEIDPAYTRSDNLVGNIIGTPDKLPPVLDELSLKVKLMDYVVGLEERTKVKNLAVGEQLMLNVWTAIGKGNVVVVKLARPVSAEKNTRVAVSRRIANRFRLIGFGITQ